MARIVMVHGAFNELWGPNELKARWLPALRDGLWHHGVEIDDADAEVCFYGDLFRRAPGTDEDRRVEASRAGIADALSNLSEDDVIHALSKLAGEAAFDRTVDMMAIMATEPDLQAQMRARMESVVGSETRVIVAHSLGSLLSYIALSNHPEWAVDTYVTLGSPLASPMLDGWAKTFVDEFGAWPGTVKRWVNVRARDDKACIAPLAEKFGPKVEEVIVDNGHRAHAPEPYLNSAVTGGAIAAALS